MADFNKAVSILLQHEGGEVNDPDDRGGHTNFGITQDTLTQYNKETGLDYRIETLTPEIAGDIYYSMYWMPMKGNQIQHQDVANVLFSCVVNMGPKTAVRKMQRVLGLKEDGIIGPQTLKNVNQADPRVLVNFYVAEIERFYEAICARRPSQRKFLNGWKNRIRSFWVRNV